MSKKENKRKGGIGKFIAGAAVGAGLGILFAPQKGSETRRALKEKLDELVKKAKEIDINEVREEVEAKVEEIKAELEDLDKEKALKIAKQKAKVLQAKVENLYDYAVAKGTPVVEKIAADIKEKTLTVAKEVVEKLEEEKKEEKKGKKNE